jgi:DNA-binding LacI/PurR family transcriptional regulator
MNILDKITVNPRLEATLTQQLKGQLTWLIASGQLEPGDILPSVRRLARHLSINMNTVRSAYQKLGTDGLVETRQGLGTSVLSYDPGRMAQMASSLHSHTVGVIIPSLSNPFYHSLLQGVEYVASQAQTMLFMCVTHDDPGDARRYFAQMAVKNVDGIILASHNDEPFLSPGAVNSPQGLPRLPFVAVDWPDSAGYVVLLDLENAGYQAARHLLEHGHRRVGLITYVADIANVRPVNRGYLRALQEAGIERDPDLIAPVQGFDMTAGSEGARVLLARERPPTAIFAIADMLAIGAMRAIRKAGLRIPQDIAMTSFNDIPLAALVDPPLTTVSAPTVQMGQAAMKMLQSLIAGKRPAHKRLTLPTSLVIRQSCGAHETPQDC